MSACAPLAAPPAPPRPRRIGLLARARSRAATVAQLVSLLRRTGRWWLLPMVAIFLASAVVLAAVHLVEYAAPFVYTLF
jgi:hypothetical protein